MKKIIFTRPSDGGVSIVIPVDKDILERSQGPMTDTQYVQHVMAKSIPKDAINVREVDDSDIPSSREFRDSWVDISPESTIDINLEKAKDIKLKELRKKRDRLMKEKDVEFMVALEKGEDLTSIKAEKDNLRNITEPLKNLDVKDKINDPVLLQEIRDLGKI